MDKLPLEITNMVIDYIHDWRVICLLAKVLPTDVEKVCGENIRLQFGKYKDRLVYDVLQENPGYVAWMHTNGIKDFGCQLQQHAMRCTLCNVLMSYGKYKGRMFKRLPRDYVSWVKYNPRNDPYLNAFVYQKPICIGEFDSDNVDINFKANKKRKRYNKM